MPQKTILLNCIKQIIGFCFDANKKLSNRKLLEFCKPLGVISNGTVNSHLPHEITETALNYLIQESLATKILNAKNPHDAYQEQLEPLVSLLPTQTWRSIEQNKWQQFSTPPKIACLLAYLLNLKSNEQILEPSAGTGSLAVWADGLVNKVYTNEIDERRRQLLKFLDFNPTSYNAEYIHDYLPPEIKPDVVMMNPPFSSNGGRTKNNSSKYGFRHVSSALQRLKSGGKFGIILGNSAGLNTKSGRKFWQGLSSLINLKAVIKIDGREYYKYGTSVDINLMIGTKYIKPQEKTNTMPINKITNISIERCEEGFAATKKLNLRLD